MLFCKRQVFKIDYRLWACVFGLSALISCQPKHIPVSDKQAQITGIINFQERPAADANIYVYQALNGVGVYSEDRSKIKRILRSQTPERAEGEEETHRTDTTQEDLDIDEYPEYRGPADYKSALTSADGRYSLLVPPGRYVLVARKRIKPETQVGPLTPQDYSSLVSKPLTVEAGKIYDQDFQLERLVEQSIDFNTRYAIKTRETEIQGTVLDEKSHPLAGYYVTAKRNLKVSNRPDFISDPSDSQGRYLLYLPGEGVYYLELRRSPLGEVLPVRFNSNYVNSTDNSLEILEGESLGEVQVILNLPITPETKDSNNNTE